MTVGTLTAGICHTRIHTAFIQTVLVSWTIIVATALCSWYLGLCHLRGVTFDAWITLVTSWATTLCIMIACTALGIDTTAFQATSVQAATVETNL